MKIKLLLCGAALLVAGCSSPQNPYAVTGEYSYSYDLVPQPVPDLTAPEMDKIEQLPVVSSSSALGLTGIGSEYSGR
jgi:hypothetical protein